MNSPEVTHALPSDEDELMVICHELHQENGLFDMDDDMVRAMLRRAFDRQGGIIGIIRGEKKIEAAIYAMLSNFWYSKDNHIEELFSFVREPYRKSNHAAALLEFAKKCSTQIGIPLVIGVLTNKKMEAKVRLYQRKLAVPPAGAFFVYNSTKWHAEEMAGDDLWRAHSRGRKSKISSLNGSIMTTSALPVMAIAK